jgi:glycine cleavage system H lipoate-binding protein
MNMFVSLFADIFATKSVEYLLVIGFLAVFVVFWALLTRRERAPADRARVARPRVPGSWFGLPPGLYYHTGHSWAVPERDGVVTVGIDDFAQKLVGKPSAVRLPSVGDRVEQGGRGPRFWVGRKSVDLLSPVDGEVVATNQAVLEHPELVNEDPYGEGWLVKVAPSRPRADLATLMTDGVAAAWMTTVENNLRRRMSGELGMVLQDGGVPIGGIARSMAGDEWDGLAGEFLLNAWLAGGSDERAPEAASAP